MKRFTDTFRESTTLKCVLVALALLFGRFVVGDMNFGYGEFSAISAAEFGIAFAAIMAPWLHREWRKDRYKDKDNV